MNFGRGSATVAYLPMTFEGKLAVTELAIALNFGGDQQAIGRTTPILPLATIPPTCPNPPTPDCGPIPVDGLPEVELLDITTQAWVRLPHLGQGSRYSVAEPKRFVDPASGAVLVRYVNDKLESVGFATDLSITGDVR